MAWSRFKGPLSELLLNAGIDSLLLRVVLVNGGRTHDPVADILAFLHV